MISNQGAESLELDNLGRLGWKYYNQIKKKAMEQEFSWSGLILSLSIAFFIVIATAQGLNILHESILNKGAIQAIPKMEQLRSASSAVFPLDSTKLIYPMDEIKFI